MIALMIPIIFVFSTSCKAETTLSPKTDSVEIDTKSRYNEGNRSDIDYDVYAYFLPYLRVPNTTHDYNYNYYDSDYYDVDEKTVDDASVTTADVGSVDGFQKKSTDATPKTTNQGRAKPKKVPVAIKITKRAAKEGIPTSKKTIVQKLCVQRQVEGSDTKLLTICLHKDAFEYACVGPDNQITACRELAFFNNESTPICVRKEKLLHVVACNDSSKEFCFLKRNDKELVTLCKNKLRKVCLLDDGGLEYCHTKDTPSDIIP